MGQGRERRLRSSLWRFPHVLRLFGSVFSIGALLAFSLALLVGTTLRNQLLESDNFRAQIERSLSTLAGPGADVQLSSLDVRPDFAGLLKITLNDVDFVRPGSGQLRVGQVELGLKLSPLLREQVRIASIAISDLDLTPTDWFRPQSRLTWDEVVVGFELRPALVALSERLRAWESALRSRGLEEIEISDVRLLDLDRFGLRANDAVLSSFKLQRDALYTTGLSVRGMLRLGDEDVALNGSWQAPESVGEARTLSLALKGFDLGLLPRMRAGTSTPIELASELAASVRLPFDASGQPKTGHARVSLEAGRLWFGDVAPVALHDAGLNLRVDPNRNSVAVLPSTFRTAALTGRFAGGFAKTTEGNVDFEFATQHLESSAGNVTRPIGGALRVAGLLRPAAKSLDLEQLRFEGLESEFETSGSLDLSAWTPGVRLSAATNGLKLQTLKAYWPPFVAGSVRRWLVGGGATGGTILKASLEADIPPEAIRRLRSGGTLGPGELSMTIRVEDVTLRLPGELPPIQGATGTVRVAGVSAAGHLARGRIATANGSIDISGSGLSIADYLLKGLPAKVNVVAAGHAQDMLVLAGTEPLAITRAIGVRAVDARGDVSLMADLHTPLKLGSGERTTDWKALVKLRKGSLARRFKGRRVKEADLAFQARPGSVRISGTATVDGYRTRLALVEPFGPTAAPDRAERQVALRLDASARKRLGIDLGSMVRGPIDVRMRQGPSGWQRVEVDLTNAVVDLDLLAWRKGNAVPARAVFRMRTVEGVTEIVDLVLDGAGTSGRGSLSLDRRGLRTMALSDVSLAGARGMEISVRRKRKAYAVSVKGETFDARSLLATIGRPKRYSAEQKGGRTRLDGLAIELASQFDRLDGYGGQSISGAKIELRYGAKGLEDFAVRGSLAGREVVGNMREVAGATALRMDANDAGALLRFANVYDKMNGGRLLVRLKRNRTGRFEGPVRFLDFKVSGEEKLNRLLASGSRSQDGRVARVASVAEASAIVSSLPGRLTVSEGRLRGGDMAATFEGVVYDPAGRTKLKGTFLPAYGLNRMVSAIPFIGLAAGSGRDKGLLGITFRLNGAWRAPQLTVNPLSVLAPGVFRKIFE